METSGFLLPMLMQQVEDEVGNVNWRSQIRSL